MGYGSAYPNGDQLFSCAGLKYGGLFSTRKLLPFDPCTAFGFGAEFKTSALRKSNKKFKGDGNRSDTEYLRSKIVMEDNEHKSDGFSTQDDTSCSNSDDGTISANREISNPSRNAVLQACIVTSCSLLALGIMIRLLILRCGTSN